MTLEQEILEQVKDSKKLSETRWELAEILSDAKNYGIVNPQTRIIETDLALNLLEAAGYLKANDQGNYEITPEGEKYLTEEVNYQHSTEDDE